MCEGESLMSVTIEDVLQLPSLRRATLVAGYSALKNIVTSISVLEYTTPGRFPDEFYEQNAPYINGELCITGFISICNDVEAQLKTLRGLAEVGEIGVILYYVGVLIPSLDQRLIDLADELGLALIVMPKGRIDIRYSDVITEVMEAIFRDRLHDDNIVTETIEIMSRLPAHQQTVDMALNLLSQRLQATITLTNTELQPLGEAVWPRHGLSLVGLLRPENVPTTALVPRAFEPLEDSMIWFAPIRASHGPDMNLYIIKEGTTLREEQIRLSAETLQLSVELWSRQHSAPVRSELVRAILLDEPIKMRRLAEVLGIDVGKMHSMWLLRPTSPEAELTQEAVHRANALLSAAGRTVLTDLYSGNTDHRTDMIIFFNSPGSISERDSYAQELVSQLGDIVPCGVTLTIFHYLQTTAAVRTCYHMWDECIWDAQLIQPGARIFLGQDIEFTRRCRETIHLGERSVTHALAILDALHEMKNSKEYLRTLGVFLLDAGANVQRTAELMFVHKNTVQYRLRQISDGLGFNIGDMPASQPLYEALAISRLLKNSE